MNITRQLLFAEGELSRAKPYSGDIVQWVGNDGHPRGAGSGMARFRGIVISTDLRIAGRAAISASWWKMQFDQLQLINSSLVYPISDVRLVEFQVEII